MGERAHNQAARKLGGISAQVLKFSTKRPKICHYGGDTGKPAWITVRWQEIIRIAFQEQKETLALFLLKLVSKCFIECTDPRTVSWAFSIR